MKIICVLITAILVLGMVAGVAAQTPDLDGTYVDPDGEYAFDYPADWRIVPDDTHLGFGVPNNDTSPTMYFSSSLSPMELIEYLNFTESKPEEMMIGDRNGAKLVDHSFATSADYAVEFAPGKTAMISVFTNRAEAERWEPLFLAILESMRVPGSDETSAEAAALAEAMTLDVTYEGADITFDYPGEWFTGGYQGRAVFSNSQPHAQYREPEFIYVDSGQIVVVVYPNIELLPGLVRRVMDEGDDNAYDVAGVFGIAILIEAASYTLPDVEELEVAGHDAAMTILTSESEDYVVLTVELAPEEVVTIIGVSEVAEMYLFQNTILAMAESLAKV